MTCKEVEKWIPLFLKDDLDTDDLREFVEHIDKCEECSEELSIQFLVQEGMARLEAGNVFDLQNELKHRMDVAQHTLKRRESLKWLLVLLDGFVLVEIVIIIILLIVL